MQTTLTFFGAVSVPSHQNDLFVVEVGDCRFQVRAGLDTPGESQTFADGRRTAKVFLFHAREITAFMPESEPLSLPAGIWALTSNQLSRVADLGELDKPLALPSPPASTFFSCSGVGNETDLADEDTSQDITEQVVEEPDSLDVFEQLSPETVSVLYAVYQEQDHQYGGGAYFLSITSRIHNYANGTDYEAVEQQTRDHLNILAGFGLVIDIEDCWTLTDLGYKVSAHG